MASTKRFAHSVPLPTMYSRIALRSLFLFVVAILVASCDWLGSDEDAARPLLQAGTYGSWIWGPDGTEIIYTHQSTIQAISISDGTVRTLVEAPSDGTRLLRPGLALSADGRYLTYRVFLSESSSVVPPVALHRFALSGASPPERMAEGFGDSEYAVSPDMTMIAEGTSRRQGRIRLLELASGTVDSLDVGIGTDDGIVWSPDGRQLVAAGGGCTLQDESAGAAEYATEFAWVDVAASRLSIWRAPCDIDAEALPPSIEGIRWEGGEPVLYTYISDRTIARLEIPSGNWEEVYTLRTTPTAPAFSWSPGGDAFTFWDRECTKWEDAFLGSGRVCRRSVHRLRYVSLREGREREIAAFTTSSLPVYGGSGRARFAPDGRTVAYERSAGTGRQESDGIYVHRLF